MSIITAIKQQKDKNRVNVYLDDKFGFGIDLDNFVTLNLRIGQELTEGEIQKIVKKAEFQKTLDKLLQWAMGRLHSEKEIREYLSKRKVPEMIYKDLFLKLKHFDLVDDEKFARMWIEDRLTIHPKSIRMLKHELRIKGIGKEIIDKVLGENEIDEDKIAKSILLKRELHWRRFDTKDRGQKMIMYLVGKGFDFEVARKAAKEYNMEHV